MTAGRRQFHRHGHNNRRRAVGALDEVDLLYLGGGFPETHASHLADNGSMRQSIQAAASRGLPMYAECGGMIYLSRSVRHAGRTWPMAGVFDFDVEIEPRPQGHGYVEAVVDRPNPFFQAGTTIRGHDFHYGRVVGDVPPRDLTLSLRRGSGVRDRRDGLVRGDVFASWTHVHALGLDAWAPALVARAAAKEQPHTPCCGSAPSR